LGDEEFQKAMKRSWSIGDVEIPEELRRKWEEFERKAKRIRRERADWDFIRSQPPRIRAALELYVETGDIRLAQHISGLVLEEFIELTKKAGIPTGL